MSESVTSDGTEPTAVLSAANDQSSLDNNAAAVQAGVLHGISSDALKDILQAAGFRVDLVTVDGGAFLRSATGGLPFEVRLMNPVAEAVGFADVTFVTHFTVEGIFPVDLLNQWNKGRRFARLFVERTEPGREFLVMCQDLSLAGGIAPDHVRAHVVIWDAMVQQLIAWLRSELPKAVPAVQTESEAQS